MSGLILSVISFCAALTAAIVSYSSYRQTKRRSEQIQEMLAQSRLRLEKAVARLQEAQQQSLDREVSRAVARRRWRFDQEKQEIIPEQQEKPVPVQSPATRFSLIDLSEDEEQS